jgi:hypothetical protein
MNNSTPNPPRGLIKPELKSPSLLGEGDLGSEANAICIQEFNAAISNFRKSFSFSSDWILNFKLKT